jgi:hypothetical protein
MIEELRSALGVAVRAAKDLDADGVRGPDAAALFAEVVAGERAIDALKALLAARVDDTGVYRSAGCQSAVAWVAQQSGSTFASAKRTLAVGSALDDMPEVSTAFRGGELSLDQAAVVVDVVERVPHAAPEMIRYAKRHTVKALREKATRMKCAAEPDDDDWADRLRTSRFHRRWTSDDGAGCGEYRLEPQAAAKLWAVLDGLETDIFEAARKRDPQDRESRQAYAADALVALATGVVPAKVSSLQVIIDGDTAELRGVGPIPMRTALDLTNGRPVVGVPRDGSHLDGYESFGRYLPADLRRWLEHHYPTCGVEGCDRDHHLEVDHVMPLSEGGTTTRENLWRICPYHHDLKTHRGWTAAGEPHAWTLEPPAPPGEDPP